MTQPRDPATGVLLCGHGSRDDEACAEFEAMARRLGARLPYTLFASGYLEFARPTIREALESLREAGARRILAVPAMLFAAGHVKNDLPWELNSFAAENAGIAVEFGRDLAVDPKLLEAARERISAAEARATRNVARADSLLLVVGRGTSDPDANANVAKVARLLWEGMGFGWAALGYSGVASPRTDEALTRAVRLGFPRIVVFPYFLFTGILVKRVYEAADDAARRHPEIEFLKADYLGDHALVLDALAERVDEIITGDNRMNCRLCKYRERIIGYEGDLGRPQAGHHLHVRGIGTDGDHQHSHEHDHPHEHGHAHTHPPKRGDRD